MTTDVTTEARGRPIRIGLAGLGLVAQAVHIPRLATLRDRFEVAHVCDLSSRLSEVFADALPGSVRASVDLRTLLDDPGVDAVLILTSGAHAEEALAALRAGKHVFVEKPLCTTIAEADALAEAAQQADRVLQVGYMKMHDPLIGPARSALSGLGKANSVRVKVLHPDHDHQTAHLHVQRFDDADQTALRQAREALDAAIEEAVGDVPARLRQLYGGVLLGSLIHQLSVLRALGLGLPVDITYAEAGGGGDNGGLAHVLVLGRLGNGARLEISWHGLGAYPAYVEDVEVLSGNAGMRLRLASPYAPGPAPELRVYQDTGGDSVSESRQPVGADGLTRQLIAFHEAVVANAPVGADVVGAKADIECLQAIVAAVAAREGVAVGGEAGGIRRSTSTTGVTA